MFIIFGAFATNLKNIPFSLAISVYPYVASHNSRTDQRIFVKFYRAEIY